MRLFALRVLLLEASSDLYGAFFCFCHHNVSNSHLEKVLETAEKRAKSEKFRRVKKGAA